MSQKNFLLSKHKLPDISKFPNYKYVLPNDRQKKDRFESMNGIFNIYLRKTRLKKLKKDGYIKYVSQNNNISI